jgi:hypothetical protein
MAKWIALAVVLALATGLPRPAAAQRLTKLPEASAGVAVFDGRGHARQGQVRQGFARRDIVRYAPRPDPHYYARPVRYRPYPYGVPAPFVFGYGPWW